MKIMKIIIAGGGTGGHIYPVISIAKTFIKNGEKVVLIGRKNSKEESIYKSNKFYIRVIESSMLELTPKKLIKFTYKVSKGVREAMHILKEENPDAVIGAGGYVSAPIVFAAMIKKVPFFLYEQNVVPGRTNRLFSKKSRKILLGFPDIYGLLDKKKAVFTGNPIRMEITNTARLEGLKFLNLDDKPTLLVFGGSGGARKINHIFSSIINKLLQKIDIQIIFITGKRDYPTIKREITTTSKNLRIIPYLERMEYAIAVSDLAVARAGAMTLTELTKKGVPAIIVPFPYARDDHQKKNALFLKNKGCIDLVEESSLSESLLLNKVVYYFSHPDIINTMKEKTKGIFPEDSAKIIYKIVKEQING